MKTLKIESGLFKPRPNLNFARQAKVRMALPTSRLTKNWKWPFLAALLTAPVLLFAQQYAIDWYKVSGGGGTSTGGVYAVSGTIGQHDAGGPMTGGNYSLTGGFWSLISVMQTPGLPLLMITLNSQLSTVTVSWLNTGSYTLQTNNNLNTSSWLSYGGTINTSNDTNSVTIAPPTGNLFFRLKQP